MAVKISASEAAVWAAGELMQLLGGRGYMENNVAPQLLRDARVLTVGEGPNETLGVSLGRSASQTDTIHRFLTELMGVPELARRLRDDVNQVAVQCTTGANAATGRSAAVSWACSLAGKVTCDALLLAAVQGEIARHPSRHLARMLGPTRLRYEEGLAQALKASAGQATMLTAQEAAEIITGYVETIGDVEQELPGEEDVLDPLLRRDPGAAPGEPPRRITGRRVLVAQDEPSVGASSPLPFAPLSAEAKRALLERALQQRIAAAELSPSF